MRSAVSSDDALTGLSNHVSLDAVCRDSEGFDRQIIAQALVENTPVVTPDESFNLHEGLNVVW